ncbi:Stealth CR1 domain-containing protein [Agaribacterium haliotis]|uniref:Stealth CR1 domain-containing protein n=1 Tax=Agaribacterium haliotis TaxID=2013869 RepID=UPI0013045E6E|nr:Stealth CR1 domain-containing protein [Agaribacterium haliotis]
MDNEIDAVITWVDGSDTKHLDKLTDYLRKRGLSRPASVNADRLSDLGEIEYCVASLLEFAPWLHKIYIVTDKQTPAFLNKQLSPSAKNKITVIDHQQIFSDHEDKLPCFNARSIQTMLHRIPGLKERYLYLNDDFALLQNVEIDDFFIQKKMVLRGQWSLLPPKKLNPSGLKRQLKSLLNRRFSPRPSYLYAQQLAAYHAGLTYRYLKLEHNAHPCLKQDMLELEHNKRELFSNNITPPFRDHRQFMVYAYSAYRHIKSGQFCIDKQHKTLTLYPGRQDLAQTNKLMQQANEDSSYMFCCVQSLSSGSPAQISSIKSWLGSRIPVEKYWH